jgi:hypothetical protein
MCELSGAGDGTLQQLCDYVKGRQNSREVVLSAAELAVDCDNGDPNLYEFQLRYFWLLGELAQEGTGAAVLTELRQRVVASAREQQLEKRSRYLRNLTVELKRWTRLLIATQNQPKIEGGHGGGSSAVKSAEAATDSPSAEDWPVQRPSMLGRAWLSADGRRRKPNVDAVFDEMAYALVRSSRGQATTAADNHVNESGGNNGRHCSCELVRVASLGLPATESNGGGNEVATSSETASVALGPAISRSGRHGQALRKFLEQAA